MTGQTLGYLTVLGYRGSDGTHTLWALACVCGKEVILRAGEIGKQRKRGVWSSCGCKKRETISARRTTHGMSKHPAFAVWRSMNDRCHLPSHQAWRNYGARGIAVCERWRTSFAAFWGDMGPTYQSGLTLEREDNSKGYEPGNCVWATYRRQMRNTRRNVLINTPWGLITVAEAAERSGIGRSTLYYRVSTGVPESRLFEAPDSGRKFTIW